MRIDQGQGISHSAGAVRKRGDLMLARADQQSAEMVNSLLEFSVRVSEADAAVFFWVGPQCEVLDPLCRNFDKGALELYTEQVGRFDPLCMNRLRAQESHVAVLSHYRRQTAYELDPTYQAHLSAANVGDELSMVFWRGQEPFACLVLTRTPQQSPFSLDSFDWLSLKTFVQSSLQMHWRMRTKIVETTLVQKFSITPRELEVIRYVLRGKSNEQIASILGIGVATIKSHIVSILNKTGADSRLGIVCLVNSLQFGEHWSKS